MRVLAFILMLLVLPGAGWAAPCCGPITPEGVRLARFLDGTGVDHLWQAGQRVNWETGEAIRASKPSATHCSAYAAAVAARLGIYLLRPPQHSEDFLANAQMAWLRGAQPAAGWRSLPDPAAAQAAANRGDLVVAVFENPNPARSGHIAVVRPSLQSAEALALGGPREAQAGAVNALDISTADGFAQHPGAWEPGGGGAIRYFAHKVDWSKAPRAG